MPLADVLSRHQFLEVGDSPFAFNAGARLRHWKDTTAVLSHTHELPQAGCTRASARASAFIAGSKDTSFLVEQPQRHYRSSASTFEETSGNGRSKDSKDRATDGDKGATSSRQQDEDHRLAKKEKDRETQDRAAAAERIHRGEKDDSEEMEEENKEDGYDDEEQEASTTTPSAEKEKTVAKQPSIWDDPDAKDSTNPQGTNQDSRLSESERLKQRRKELSRVEDQEKFDKESEESYRNAEERSHRAEEQDSEAPKRDKSDANQAKTPDRSDASSAQKDTFDRESEEVSKHEKFDKEAEDEYNHALERHKKTQEEEKSLENNMFVPEQKRLDYKQRVQEEDKAYHRAEKAFENITKHGQSKAANGSGS